jgi:hypothetical protein
LGISECEFGRAALRAFNQVAFNFVSSVCLSAFKAVLSNSRAPRRFAVSTLNLAATLYLAFSACVERLASHGSTAPTLRARWPSTLLGSRKAPVACLGLGRYSVLMLLHVVSQLLLLPNPSIERTSPGKPGAASHLKR